MKFYTPKSFKEPIRVALLSGHVTIVEYEPTELHPRFVREAIAQGAIPEGVPESLMKAADEATSDIKPEDRHAQIKQVLLDMVEHAKTTEGADEFTATGLPSIAAVKKRLGGTVTKEEVYSAWAEVNPDKGEDE